MKMNKSINDYKEAMDNIKISESFYKRTETLLTELPEVKIEKRSVISGRRVSAVIMSAAACVICLFGVKLAVDGRQSGIVAETAADGEEAVSLEEITEDNEADELIDDLAEYDDADITAESISPDSLDGGNAQDGGSKPIAVNPAASAETEAPSRTSAQTSANTTAPPPAAEPKTASSAAEGRVVEGIDPYGGSQNSAEPKDKDSGEAPAAGVPNPTAFGNPGVDSDGVDIMDEEDEYAEAAPTALASESLLFGELSLENVTVDVTPYFDMESIKSGESTIKKSGAEFKPILDLMSDISKEPSVTKINNGSFTSVFSIRIYDANIDLDFYSIYLTNSSTIVITKHSPNGSQSRETYALREEHYEAIRHQLFLLFGSESEYELFLNLASGK